MDRETFLNLHKGLCETARDLSARKGHDYSGDEDHLANLKRSEALDITSASAGVLLRESDKLSRATTLLKHEAQVDDESFLDTALDGINYWLLLVALLYDRGDLQSDTLDELTEEGLYDSVSEEDVDQGDPSTASVAHKYQRLKTGGFYLEENVNVRGMTSGPLKELTISLVGVETCLCGGVPKLLSNPGAGEEVWCLACRECGATCASFKTQAGFEDTETMVASLERMTRVLTDLWNRSVEERRGEEE